ncbi:DEAD/DEAH box helicase [Desulforhopalus singaporensis]|uniref:ATP-dependent RNA helicase DeaD n=1 Tax=Desulforhopalus singaporensis TaxID=91360 RepID=A0A1H0IVR5_9BACT|nr:DEAD/DEAH box helicase [Desulforhopalus singaporensis]SDO35300.1 ATP-dependent RNA helicase DeaD [Desulforhopalus singaporensis]
MSDDFLTVIQDFTDLGLAPPLLKALEKEGYEEPTPIQAKIIPHVLSGQDVVGQAQTGTGKTAAFALPLLNNLRQGSKRGARVMVLAPTRELALQISEAVERYGAYIPNLNVLALYGGEEYGGQLSKLRRGVDVVVGTPGRVMDHIRRGSLDLSGLEALVLDEADEMLRMGFIDDVEWIVAQTPPHRQIALFSATMPVSVRRIAATYLNDPVEITIADKTATAATIEQRFLMVNTMGDKKEALKKILETQDSDGVLIFVRTKMQTVELAEYLGEFGYKATALNGDIPQNQRMRNVEMLKAGKIDILVATDVAARGLDVERISHVINFDVPFDTESYIHRIGRTGRAGRVGKAILFISPRQKSMLRSIERATRQKIEAMKLPSVAEINRRRLERYKQRITETLASDCTVFKNIIGEYCKENQTPAEHVAAALAKMMQGATPLFLEDIPERPVPNRPERGRRKPERKEHGPARPTRRATTVSEEGMCRYRLEVGEMDGVKPGNIVGAIANEADIDSKYIGRVAIFNDFSTVDLPTGMPRAIQKVLYNARINGKSMRLRMESETGGVEDSRTFHAARKGQKKSRAQKPVHSTKRKNRNRAVGAGR